MKKVILLPQVHAQEEWFFSVRYAFLLVITDIIQI
jgi:hypothetical protein